jgi:hypothetical protein
MQPCCGLAQTFFCEQHAFSNSPKNEYENCFLHKQYNRSKLMPEVATNINKAIASAKKRFDISVVFFKFFFNINNMQKYVDFYKAGKLFFSIATYFFKKQVKQTKN